MKLNTLKFSGLLLFAVATSINCGNQSHPPAEAYQITAREQLIGGPTALGEIGDYMLENSNIRVIIQKIGYNRGSGVFGGSLIDADIVRPQNEGSALGGNGRDQFGEMFPAFFAEMIDPESISIINDGKDGKAAILEVRGRGGEFITMARYVNQFMTNSYEAGLGEAIQGAPPWSLEEKKNVEFSTRYILEPDAKHVRIESKLENYSSKSLTFPNKEIVSLIGGFMGIDLSGFRLPAGHVVGFGALSKLFTPGIGFDLKFGLNDAYNTSPARFPALPGVVTPFVASTSTNGVSYGYATEAKPTENFVYARDQEGQHYGGHAKPGDQLLLFYASGFTGIYTHQIPEELRPAFCDVKANSPKEACQTYYYPNGECPSNNEDTCRTRVEDCVAVFEQCSTDWKDLPSSYTYTNYFLVGQGDIDSIQGELYKINGTETESIVGRAFDQSSGSPLKPGANILAYKKTGSLCSDNPNIYSQTTTQDDGFFQFSLPEGQYCFRVQQPNHPLGDFVYYDTSRPKHLKLVGPSAGHIIVKVIDENNRPLPAKLTTVGVHEFKADTELRHFLFDQVAGEKWRPSDLIPDSKDDDNTRQYIENISFCNSDGLCEQTIRPGKYKFVLSRGPVYNTHEVPFEIKPGEILHFNAQLTKAFLPDGYANGDFHLHAEGSIDSGLDNNVRIHAVVAEGLDTAISTDHNYVSDYTPYIYRNNLQDWVSSIIGIELTTFEGGHFNAFPLRYDPGSMNRGSIPWQDIPPQEIFDELRDLAPNQELGNIIQVNHPRMNIMGYFSQHYVDPFTTEVKLPFQYPTEYEMTSTLIASNGPAFVKVIEDENGDKSYVSTFSWDFDAIEVFNGKHFEELRSLRMPYDKNQGEISPELFATLKKKYAGSFLAGDKLNDKLKSWSGKNDVSSLPKDDYSKLLNQYIYGTINNLDFNNTSNKSDQEVTDAADAWTTQQIPEKDTILCNGNKAVVAGALDDWYNLLNRARPDGTYRKYTATGNSDSHSATLEEPGYPRNFFYVGHNDPASITEESLVKAIRSHHNFVTNGPFATMTINGQPMGSEINASGEVEIEVNIAAAPWVGASRFRIVANGETLRNISPDQSSDTWGWVNVTLDQNNWYKKTFKTSVTTDTWFVLEVESDNNLFPVVSPQDKPAFSFDGVLNNFGSSFGFGSESLPGMQREDILAVHGFGFSNPIWVNADGNNQFDPPNPPVQRCSQGKWTTALHTYDPNHGSTSDPNVNSPPKRLQPGLVPENLFHKPPFIRERGEKRDVRAIFDIFGGHNH